MTSRQKEQAGSSQPTEFTEEEQRKRDKLLHKLLETPPQSREEMRKARADMGSNRKKERPSS